MPYRFHEADAMHLGAMDQEKKSPPGPAAGQFGDEYRHSRVAANPWASRAVKAMACVRTGPAARIDGVVSRVTHSPYGAEPH